MYHVIPKAMAGLILTFQAVMESTHMPGSV